MTAMEACVSNARMKGVTITAPSKVNTLLRVIGKRPDGFHDLEMVMVPLTLADEITIEEIQKGIEFQLDGEGDAGMSGEKNLAFRAAALMREAAGVSIGVSIRLKKKIPIAAGLGGGSSDAAAVLKGLNLLWNLGWSPDRLAGLGVGLGADVPFFCHEGAAYVEGIGDRVSPCSDFPDMSFILVNPGFSVPTPWVYEQYDLELTPKYSDARVRPHFRVFSDVCASLHNDLEAVTSKAFPEIREIRKTLLDFGAAGAMMSGSGPTVFGIFEGAADRDRAMSMPCGRKWRVFGADVWRGFSF